MARSSNMILGLSFEAFTQFHVVLSLIGIATGAAVAFGMAAGKRFDVLTGVFLATTVLTSVTGFLFPIGGATPAVVFGVLSLIVLAIALLARYGFGLEGAWRWIYVVTAFAALYLNAFVGIVQAFQKQPLLQPLAPTQTEPPFVAAQVFLLAFTLFVGALALRRFHPLRQI